jgi:hypothetical protein
MQEREAMSDTLKMKRYAVDGGAGDAPGATTSLWIVCLAVLQVLSLSFPLAARSQGEDSWNEMIGSAYTGNRSYALLQQLCDEAGGRVMGTPVNEKAMAILIRALQTIGYEAKKESFSAPGWIRGNDEVTITEPVLLSLRTVALGYVDRVRFRRYLQDHRRRREDRAGDTGAASGEASSAAVRSY